MATLTWRGDRDLCIGVPHEGGAPYLTIYKLDPLAKTATLVDPAALGELPNHGIFKRGLGYVQADGQLVITGGIMRDVAGRWQEMPAPGSRYAIVDGGGAR